ncbi:putative PPM-type phosphatase domain superfamily [Helianthus annuus]|nr:putative PPM-type phosphatase domain superfamily [Helianthus annuus]
MRTRRMAASASLGIGCRVCENRHRVSTEIETSGTIVTFVVTSVGDSRCILDTQAGVVSLLTVDHRLGENVEERERSLRSKDSKHKNQEMIILYWLFQDEVLLRKEDCHIALGWCILARRLIEYDVTMSRFQ